MPDLDTVATALTCLRDYLHVPVTWKTTTMWHVLTGKFKEDLYHHCSSFCMAVKGDHMKRCGRQESQGLLEAAETASGSFVKICHAGVVELVVPIVSAGRVEGFLLAGPFRQKGVSCPYPQLESAYAKLPEFREGEHKRLEAVLELFACGLRGISEVNTASRKLDPRIQKAQAFIRMHFQEPLRVADVAAHCGLSESRMIHLFTNEMGYSFSNYLIDLRIEEARHLLADPRCSKVEVALAVGFGDQSHFTATFKKRTGLTPGQYQAELKRYKETSV